MVFTTGMEMEGGLIMVRFIGLAGKAFAGKSTVAVMMSELMPGVVVRPIAYYLKTTAIALGWDGMKDDRGRRFLQDLGQVVREYNPDGWIDNWTRNVERIVKDQRNQRGAIVIADDVRYDNEALRILEMGGQIIRIVRLSGPTLGSDLGGDHPSENGLTDLTLPRMGGLVNDSGLESLEIKVRRIVAELTKGVDLAGKTW